VSQLLGLLLQLPTEFAHLLQRSRPVSIRAEGHQPRDGVRFQLLQPRPCFLGAGVLGHLGMPIDKSLDRDRRAANWGKAVSLYDELPSFEEVTKIAENLCASAFFC
jgi:hypothetical protein